MYNCLKEIFLCDIFEVIKTRTKMSFKTVLLRFWSKLKIYELGTSPQNYTFDTSKWSFSLDHDNYEV